MMRARVNRRKAPPRSWRLPHVRINKAAVLVPLAMLAGAAVLIPIAREFLDRPVGALVVEGTFQRVTAIEVQEAAADALSGGFLSLDLPRLRASIATLDWVDSVHVTRAWPDTVRVRITEHQAAARWGDTGLLNARGELFTENARHTYAELPQLSGPPGSEAEVARLYLAVRGRLADAHLSLAALRLDGRRAVEIVLGTGQVIKLGNRDLDQRLKRLFAVAAPTLADELKRVDYIDLRYTNGFAVGWQGPAPADATLARATGIDTSG
jgi:cell division protein FtsQ